MQYLLLFIYKLTFLYFLKYLKYKTTKKQTKKNHTHKQLEGLHYRFCEPLEGMENF